MVKALQGLLCHRVSKYKIRKPKPSKCIQAVGMEMAWFSSLNTSTASCRVSQCGDKQFYSIFASKYQLADVRRWEWLLHKQRGFFPVMCLSAKQWDVRKLSDHIFCDNLVDFNEPRLHEATLNFYTHAWIFSHLSIASVDAKQHLSEIVLGALVGFY